MNDLSKSIQKKSPEEQARAGSAQANLDSLERQIQYALRAAFVAF
ncbi:hypothetical protein V9K97_05155 [Variovorax sp. CCNWLW186]